MTSRVLFVFRGELPLRARRRISRGVDDSEDAKSLRLHIAQQLSTSSAHLIETKKH
jgi:hypothetical protein